MSEPKSFSDAIWLILSCEVDVPYNERQSRHWTGPGLRSYDAFQAEGGARDSGCIPGFTEADYHKLNAAYLNRTDITVEKDHRNALWKKWAKAIWVTPLTSNSARERWFKKHDVILSGKDKFKKVMERHKCTWSEVFPDNTTRGGENLTALVEKHFVGMACDVADTLLGDAAYMNERRHPRMLDKNVKMGLRFLFRQIWARDQQLVRSGKRWFYEDQSNSNAGTDSKELGYSSDSSSQSAEKASGSRLRKRNRRLGSPSPTAAGPLKRQRPDTSQSLDSRRQLRRRNTESVSPESRSNSNSNHTNPPASRMGTNRRRAAPRSSSPLTPVPDETPRPTLPVVTDADVAKDPKIRIIKAHIRIERLNIELEKRNMELRNPGATGGLCAFSIPPEPDDD